MLDFIKRLLGFSTKQEQPVAEVPYKVEVAPVVEATPIVKVEAPVVKVEAPVAEAKPAAPAITATKKKAEPKAPVKTKPKAKAPAKAKKPKMTVAK